MGRVFIDVTQSCRSSNNSGIQVVTRNLFREISSLYNVTPIIWDNHLRKYAKLNSKELKNLSNPFSGTYNPRPRPNKQENPIYIELISSVLRCRRFVSLDKKPKKEDLLVLPEVFRDKRVFFISRSTHPTMPKAGIFYDANVLRDPLNTPKSRLKNFNNYLQCLSNCEAISCISEDSRKTFEDLDKKNALQKRIEVHPLPVTPPPTSYSSLKPSSVPLVLCVSTLGYNKNHICLLEAAEKLWKEGRNFKLELVGQADPSWTPKVLDEINRLAARGRMIKWLMHVDQDTLEEKYSDCSFTIYPSLFEGYGLPVLESLIRKKPCICGKNGALGEVSQGGGCLTLENQKDPEQLAQAIRQLLANTSLLKSLAEEAGNRNFITWKSYAKNLFSFFQNQN